MAGQAELEPTKSDEVEVQLDRDEVKRTTAKLYGAGYSRAQIARAMVDYLVPNGKERPLEQRLSQARGVLRRWEGSDKFRDLVYQLAVVKMDMATPGIFNGLVKKAKRGRVDAARLVLEVTGRHNPKADPTPPQIVVAINGMPRPSRVPGAPKTHPDLLIDPEDPGMVVVDQDED